VVRNLFGEGANPVGQTVRVKRIPCQVVGVAAQKGNSPMGTDQDDMVVVPSTTLAAKIAGGLHNYLRGEILVRAASNMTATTKADVTATITSLLAGVALVSRAFRIPQPVPSTSSSWPWRSAQSSASSSGCFPP
jgi:hypothetical protein